MKRQVQRVDLLPELRAHVARKYRTQKVAADALGFSASFLSDVLAGKKSPTQKLLDDAGISCLKTIVYYKRAA